MKPWAFVGVLALVSASAQACDELYTTVTIGSKHIGAPAGKFNEFNPGLGVECHGFYAGGYLNSLDRVSITLGKAFAVTDWAGVRLGGVTGYLVPVAPYVAGYVRLGHLELTLIPKTKHNPTVVGFSVRW